MSQILIIYTGGTIGMMSDPVTKVLKPINFEQIMDNVPELEKLNCRIKVHSFDEIIDSSNMNPEIWSELAGSGVHLRFSVNDIRLPEDESSLIVHNSLVSDVGVLKLYPGISPKVVENILSADVRGIVMETFGAGNTTTDAWFIDLLKNAV